MESNFTKIFLSHKSTDKDYVHEIKEALKVLGFDAWLDEEAMPAGVNPDRAILQGFNESCAAVFFISSSFEDERWISNEIEYARAEKRKKNDRFQIITLIIEDGTGKKAIVPPLLSTFIYKQPKTGLEALCHILRSLPIRVGLVEWKDKSISSEQSYRIEEQLTESKNEQYTKAKAALAEWADNHPGAFQLDQIIGPSTFGPKLLAAWKDYDTNPTIQGHRAVFNKFWDRLVGSFEVSKVPYDMIFQTIGDNLRIMSISHPIEILLAEKLGTRGKPTLAILINRFSNWVESDPALLSQFTKMGFRSDVTAFVWTQKWPWRI